MRRKLGWIIVLVAVSLAALTTGYLMQKDEAQAIADKWTKKADMPTARRHLSTSVVNGKIYAIGGSVGGPVLTSTRGRNSKRTKSNDLNIRS